MSTGNRVVELHDRRCPACWPEVRALYLAVWAVLDTAAQSVATREVVMAVMGASDWMDVERALHELKPHIERHYADSEHGNGPP